MFYYPRFKFALREDLKDEKQFLPKKAEEHSTGYDVRAAFENKKDLVLNSREYFKIPLGFRSYCPEGWYYQLHPRSSSFAKKQMHNLIGIIDESWEGQTLFAGQYLPENVEDQLIIKFGEPIGQIIPLKRYTSVFEEISNKDLDSLFIKRDFARKSGGFGSTNK